MGTDPVSNAAIHFICSRPKQLKTRISTCIKAPKHINKKGLLEVH